MTVIKALGTKYVHEHHQINFDDAERALRYVMSGDFKNGDDPDFAVLLKFCHKHNQSIDWLFTGDPTGMICLLAASASRNVPR